MRHTTRSLAAVCAALSLSAALGCENAVDVDAASLLVHVEDAAEHDVAFVAEADDLLAKLTIDEEGWSTTPVLVRDAPFNRVAFRFDAVASVPVQVRAGVDRDALSAWVDATLTYQDESANNAHADVDAGSVAVQLRFRLPDETDLSFLAVETFDYAPDVAGSDDSADVIDAIDEDNTQGLAADGNVVTRSQWGARSRSCGPRHTPNRLTIHHTVTPNNDSMSMPARMRQIQAFHIDGRGWCDVGYHFLIGQDGKVYQGRVENIIGAHAANANTNNVGISFIGDYTSKVPPDNMLNAAAKIMKAMSRTYGIALNRTNVKGHRQVGTTSTSCPGNQLYNRLEVLIDRARNATTGGGGGGGGSTTSDFCGASRTGFWCSGTSVVECSSGREVRRTRCEDGCQVMPPGTPDRCRPTSTPPPPAAPQSFRDVPRDHWAFRAVEALKEAGAVSGCGNGNFCPDAKLTREGAAKIIAILERGNVDVSGTAAFSDTSGDVRSWAREVVARGIMEECDPGKFCPRGAVSRAAMAAYMKRARGWEPARPSSTSFADVPLSHWASGAIERVFARGIVSGCSQDPRKYCPADDITRAAAARMIARSYGLVD